VTLCFTWLTCVFGGLSIFIALYSIAGERNNTSKIAEVGIFSHEPADSTNTPVLKLCPKCRKPTAM
jgi:hypothetical protein